MMRGYARSVVAALNQTREVNTFIPALASLYAMNPIEVPIAHEERHAGRSKYSLYSLIRLNFDLITGFSAVPLQLYLHGRHGGFRPVRLAGGVPVRAPPHRGSGSGGAVHAVRPGVLLHRIGPVRHRFAGRIRRPHLRPGARTAALYRGSRSGGGGAGATPGSCGAPRIWRATVRSPRAARSFSSDACGGVRL